MNVQENLKATGELLISLYDENGNLKDSRYINNLVVTVGKNFIASRIVGVASAVMSHMSVGTDSTAPVVGNTTLGAEVAGSRTALSGSTNTNNTVTYTATFGPGVGTGALVEAGLFNAASAGTMLARTTYAVVNKGAGDTISISWTITIS